MAILTKAQLEALNQSSFPDQSTEAITPAILRTYNTATIDTLVDSLDTGSFTTDAEFNAFTSSTNSSITQLNAATASYDAKFATIGTQSGSWGSGGSVPAGTVSSSAQIVGLGFLQTSSFNTYTSSTNSSISQLNASSASQQISINALNTNSGSVNSSITQLNASSASQQISINALNAATSSYVTSAITASSLITASFSVNTLTFTKGNGDTFGVVIPDVSGSTLPSGLLSSSVTNFTDYSTSVDSRINAITASGGIPTGTISGSQQITSLGFVSSSVTASSLITASFSGNTLTFTKGNGTTFGVVIPDVSGSGVPTGTVSSSAQILNYGIFATTGSNTFDGAQTIRATGGTPLIIDHSDASPTQNTLLAFFKSGSAEWSIGNLGTDDSFILYNPNTFQTPISVAQNNSVTLLGSLTASLQQGYAYVGDGSGKTSAVATSSFAGATINTGSFATTGSNVFTGDQTLTDAAGNTVTLDDISGSLVLVAKGATSGSAGLSNITSSANQVNLIFKSANTQSGSLTISGSNNILVSPATPTDGFVRYLTNNNIALNSNSLPQITGSAAYSPNVSSNLLNGLLTFRGPASSSAWNLRFNTLQNAALNIGSSTATSANQAIAGGTMDSNILLSTVNYNAYTTPLVTNASFSRNLAVGIDTTLTAFSSSIQANSNIFNGNTFNVNNRYFGTASLAALQRLTVSFNVLGGINSSTLTASGSNTNTSSAREVIGNTTNGSGISLGVVLNGDNSHLYSTLIHGSNLTVTGSSAYNQYQTAGGAFIGRNNSVNGTAARSAETIFAVGTGTSTSARKTGFLIDSGSNTFVEGTLNVSGSTSFNGAVNITGSLTSSLTEGYVWVGGAGNVSTLVATSSFAGGSVPTGTVSSSAQILGYNIFATTGSNTYTGYQILKNNLSFQDATGLEDNNIVLSSLNKSTLYIQNTSISSGYNSGSVLQLTTTTGSTGFGSGSTVFQMDAVYEGNRGAMKVGSTVGLGSYVQGFANKIEFAKQGGFPNTPATTFRVDAASIELSGSIKVDTGSSGSAGIVSVGSGGTAVNNGLVTSNSIILVTTQDLGSGNEYPAVVSGKTTGQFTIYHNFGGNLNVAYLIINPI